jgi:hypothetical protein
MELELEAESTSDYTALRKCAIDHIGASLLFLSFFFFYFGDRVRVGVRGREHE